MSRAMLGHFDPVAMPLSAWSMRVTCAPILSLSIRRGPDGVVSMALAGKHEVSV